MDLELEVSRQDICEVVEKIYHEELQRRSGGNRERYFGLRQKVVCSVLLGYLLREFRTQK